MSSSSPSGTATFRPHLRNVGASLVLGVVGGAALGFFVGASLFSAALLGGAAAAMALWLRRIGGLTIAASERSLEVRWHGQQFYAPWSELRLGFGTSQRPDGSAQSYAAVADSSGRTFAFADMSGAPQCGPVSGANGKPIEVIDLREAALLLALVVQRTPVWEVFPEPLRGSGTLSSDPLNPARQAQPPSAGATATRAQSPRYGILGLLAKLGSKLFASLAKLGTGGVKALKTTKAGWALFSAASYSLLFSWQFALAIMLQLFVHEYGHVHAMKRSGMRVRGMYFIPFLGAMAVTEDSFKSRREQAYVALSGPIWGSVLAFVSAGLYAWTREPLFAAIASWWAIINLFNLLPISPLDGGRAMQAFAYSFSSSAGFVVSILGLTVAAALAFKMGFSLIYLVVFLGAMEFISESQARVGVRALRLLPDPDRFGVVHYRFLRSTLGPPPGTPNEAFFIQRLAHQERAAKSPPMRPGELLGWGMVYALLAMSLVVLVYLMRNVPGAAEAASLLS